MPVKAGRLFVKKPDRVFGIRMALENLDEIVQNLGNLYEVKVEVGSIRTLDHRIQISKKKELEHETSYDGWEGGGQDFLVIDSGREVSVMSASDFSMKYSEADNHV